MKKLIVFIYCLIFIDLQCLSCLVNYCYGEIYYVSPTGNNSNPGTFQQPWATPGYGSRNINAGDTLIILGGTYLLSEYDADIIEPPSGTPNAWTVIQGETNNRPLLCGLNNLLTAMDLSGKSYVMIDNIEITHYELVSGDSCWFRNGIQILDQTSNFLIFRNLYIHHIDEFGMNFQDIQNVDILNCRIEFCGFGALGGPLGTQGGWRNVKIKNCSLSYSGHYYQGGDGSNSPYDRPDGFGIEPSSGPILIENTVVQHNYGDGLDSKSLHTTIRGCIVANNSCDGVKLWADSSRIENTLIYGRGDGSSIITPWAPIVIDQVEQAGARFEIVNVTVDDSLGNEYLLYVQYENPIPVNIVLRNCIFSGRGPNTTIFVHANSTILVDHNLFFIPHNSAVFYHGERVFTCSDLDSLGPGNICGDPLFVNPAWGTNGDYHLMQGSPAIDAGTSIGAPLVDLDGKPRDNYPDIGAYEFSSSSDVNTEMEPNLSNTFYCYPNPFNLITNINFSLTNNSYTELKIFDLLGRELTTLIKGELKSGNYSIPLNLNGLPSGIYIASLYTGNVIKQIKIILLK